ncbi:MAG: leucine-rich repeat domain-containing protein [Oscillospiraceae bacterium]|nr:leucine-rich repeat domain-containing protein [Oscillospiraceae bacterium]
MKKKILSIVLILSLSLCVLSSCSNEKDTTGSTAANPTNSAATGTAAISRETILAEPEASADLFKFTEVEGGVSITSYTGKLSILSIPKQLEGKPVVSIGENAIANHDELAGVLVPAGVSSIKTTAFGNNPALKIVIFSDGLKEVGDYVFVNCPNLEEVSFPESLEAIGEVFASNKNLKTVNIPSGVKSISSGAFYYTGITSIAWPAAVSEIKSLTFAGCEALEKITIPDSVTAIADNAFEKAANVTIVASSGSYAAQYASEKGIKFEAA